MLDDDGKGAVISDVKSFNLRNWAASAYVYLDDVKIEKCVIKPALDSSSVTMTNYKGETVATVANPEPGITKITLEFGTAIKEASLEGAVTLKTDNEDVEFSGSVSGSKYVMLLNGLKANTSYKLSVSDAVENTKENKMEDGFEFDFKTGEGSTKATLLSVEKSGENATLNAVNKGDTLKLNAAFDNTKQSEMSIEYIVGYYSGKMLKNVEVITEKAVLSGAGALENEFTIGDMDEITSVKVFMWNSAYGAYPYCTPITIE